MTTELTAPLPFGPFLIEGGLALRLEGRDGLGILCAQHLASAVVCEQADHAAQGGDQGQDGDQRHPGHQPCLCR